MFLAASSWSLPRTSRCPYLYPLLYYKFHEKHFKKKPTCQLAKKKFNLRVIQKSAHIICVYLAIFGVWNRQLYLYHLFAIFSTDHKQQVYQFWWLLDENWGTQKSFIAYITPTIWLVRTNFIQCYITDWTSVSVTNHNLWLYCVHIRDYIQHRDRAFCLDYPPSNSLSGNTPCPLFKLVGKNCACPTFLQKTCFLQGTFNGLNMYHHRAHFQPPPPPLYMAKLHIYPTWTNCVSIPCG